MIIQSVPESLDKRKMKKLYKLNFKTAMTIKLIINNLRFINFIISENSQKEYFEK